MCTSHKRQLFYFNSRPSARGDCPMGGKKNQKRISIHAPPRGATRSGGTLARQSAISIHAPPRGATMLMRQHIADYEISIHAPPRGATRRGAAQPSASRFQFTPLREGRLLCFGVELRLFRLFQFTPLREGRREIARLSDEEADFNSRPSARGDGNPASKLPSLLYFNSRPSARGDAGRPRPVHHHFNSRPSARGDGTWVKLGGGTNGYFNSRPSARGDCNHRRTMPA